MSVGVSRRLSLLGGERKGCGVGLAGWMGVCACVYSKGVVDVCAFMDGWMGGWLAERVAVEGSRSCGF